jgi:hypothetical protein
LRDDAREARLSSDGVAILTAMLSRATPRSNTITEITAKFFPRGPRGVCALLSRARYYLALCDASKISSVRRLGINALR